MFWKSKKKQELRDFNLAITLTVLVAYDRDPSILPRLVKVQKLAEIPAIIKSHFNIAMSSDDLIVDTPEKLYEALWHGEE